jgi:polysaccharide biosynthesis protein PslF
VSSITFVSTYPPTRCGLARFTRSLRTAIAGNRASGHGLEVLAISPELDGFPPEVVATIDPDALNFRPAETQWAIVQHEYGIYGANDGEVVPDLIERLQVPTITVLHTVLERPSLRQQKIINDVAKVSGALVVMSHAAEARLASVYDIGATRVANIPHGGWPKSHRPIRRVRPGLDRPVVLSWGLLGPGKGIENAIRALPSLKRLEPKPLYVIAGQTHPAVLEKEGEGYRKYLEGLIEDLGVVDMVCFINRYLSDSDLTCLLERASVCLFPYESREQVTSGALVDALMAQVPVVASRFPHAAELLSTGAGLLVEHDDPSAIGDALARFLFDHQALATARSALERIALDLAWPKVARSYEVLLEEMGLDAGAA